MLDSPFDIPADLDTPVSAFLKLSRRGPGHLEPRFLLESVEQGEQVGRFSFIGLGEALRVTLDGDGLHIGDQTLAVPSGRDDLLAGLRQAIEQTPGLSPSPADVPFTGGLVGATGYGLHHWFEDLGHRKQPGEPPLARYIAPRSVLAFDHKTRRAALLHSGEGREAVRLEVMEALAGPVSRTTPGSATSDPATPRVGGSPTEDHETTGSLSQEAFEHAVRTAQHHVREGDIFQAVLSVRFAGKTNLDPFQVYRALRLVNPSPYMYYMALPGVTLVGSSPEALVHLEGRQARLRPIAGTRPRGENATEDRRLETELLADEKEGAEHVMLVDLARNDLGRVATPGTVRVTPYRSIERYSHVMHLVSGVEGELREGVDALDLFAAAFPAGTVSGAPKVRATEIIQDLEPVPREFYAGSVGYFGRNGSMDQAITIRTMMFEGDRFSYQAGAGIVADSVPENEYREVVAKGAALRSALALAARLRVDPPT